MPPIPPLKADAWYAVWHEFRLIDKEWHWTRWRLVHEQGYDATHPLNSLPFEPMRGRQIIERLDELKGYTVR